jgi:Rab-GTPase-TBC domain
MANACADAEEGAFDSLARIADAQALDPLDATCDELDATFNAGDDDDDDGGSLSSGESLTRGCSVELSRRRSANTGDGVGVQVRQAGKCSRLSVSLDDANGADRGLRSPGYRSSMPAILVSSQIFGGDSGDAGNDDDLDVDAFHEVMVGCLNAHEDDGCVAAGANVCVTLSSASENGGAPLGVPKHERSRSNSAVFTSKLKKGWRAVKKTSVKSTASAGRQLSSLSSAYWKPGGSAAQLSRAALPMTPDERTAWEGRQSRLCEEWVASILPAWKRKRATARTRALAFRGVPPSVRGRVWIVALGNPLNIPPNLFEILKERAHDGRMEYLRHRETIDKADGDVGGNGGRAEPMIMQERSSHKAIMLDLPRTFPELAFFHADGSQYEDSLREILEAFMYLRPDIGYSQGMSFLAAVLLLYMDEPCEAFVCFVTMLLHKSCFLHFFRMKMPEVRIYLSMHDALLREEMPALHAHFKAHSVDADLYMINWVMSLYCGALPLDLVSRIWDIYVLDGDLAIFRAALGILKLLQPRLLAMAFEDMAYLLSHIPASEIEADALLLAVRGVRAVTRSRFKELFRQCSARHAAKAAADTGDSQKRDSKRLGDLVNVGAGEDTGVEFEEEDKGSAVKLELDRRRGTAELDDTDEGASAVADVEE